MALGTIATLGGRFVITLLVVSGASKAYLCNVLIYCWGRQR